MFCWIHPRRVKSPFLQPFLMSQRCNEREKSGKNYLWVDSNESSSLVMHSTHSLGLLFVAPVSNLRNVNKTRLLIRKNSCYFGDILCRYESTQGLFLLIYLWIIGFNLLIAKGIPGLIVGSCIEVTQLSVLSLLLDHLAFLLSSKP